MTIECTPPSLDLEPTSPEVKRYHRLKLAAELVSLGLSLTFLILMAVVGGVPLDRLVRRFAGDNHWIRLIVLAAIYGTGFELLTLPLGFWSSYVLEHRYQLSNLSLAGWIWRLIKGYLVGAPLALGLLVGLYVLLWFAGSWWWIWATAGTFVLIVVMGKFLPVVVLPLFFKVTRLDDPDLLNRLRRLADGTGLHVEGVYRLGLSAVTRKANAALAGLGNTRRVLLGDTLLAEFTPEEIEVVFAHEVGHHVYRHIMKLLAWSIITAAAGFWLMDLLLRHAAVALGYPGFSDPAALPLFILVPTLLGLALTPLQNAVSRFFERQCDLYALARTRTPDAYRSAFVKLARMNKTDADPNPFLVWLFDDHPPIRQRLALADLPLPPPV